jgi:hypothetical protein
MGGSETPTLTSICADRRPSKLRQAASMWPYLLDEARQSRGMTELLERYALDLSDALSCE